MPTLLTRRVPLLDLRSQFDQIRQEVMAEISRVCESQELILGETVRRFEQAIAPYCSVPHAIGCASGSDALTLALMAYDIGPGDKVLTVPFTFFATAGAIAQLGATPVFADVEPGTFNIDVPRQSEPSTRPIASGPSCPYIFTAAVRTWIRSAPLPGNATFQ